MIHFGVTELVRLLVIVILLFGVERISKIAKELGSSVRTFRTALYMHELPAIQSLSPTTSYIPFYAVHET